MKITLRRLATAGVCAALALGGIRTVAQRTTATVPKRPGPQGGGVTLLPNGWQIAPAGRSLSVGDFPMSMVATPDRRFLIISNNGWSRPTLTIVDAEQLAVKDRVAVDHAWLGLAWNPQGTRLYSSGAADNTINVFDYRRGELRHRSQLVVDRSAVRLPSNVKDLSGTGFIGGVAASADGKALYAAHVLGRGLSEIDLETSDVRTITMPAETYSVILSKDQKTLFVSLWGGAKVAVVDRDTMRMTREVAVGEHPNAMALSNDGRRLFVACANTNKVWVVDLPAMEAREQISVTMFPNAPPGTTPNALDVSPDGTTLAVANADNNTIALVDISRPGASQIKGFIPTGWYPTAVLFDEKGTRLFVLNGKGLSGQANPRGPQAVSPAADGQYAGQLLQGAFSIIPMPDPSALGAYTQKAMTLSAYTDAKAMTPQNPPAASPIPKRVGDQSPIKHVFYVIRENRTYDQVLGDLERGNGDPTLTLFGEDVTPNAHAIAREFVVLDNFFVDAEVSYDGHAFSTGAYAPDAVEKIWPTNYGRRGGVYLSEGGFRESNAYGNLAAPPNGYLWDFAKRAGVSVRSYGEFASWDTRGGPITATVPGLRGLINTSYPPYDLTIPDNTRVDVWLEEFKRFEQDGRLPRLNIVRLGNDHTLGTRAGAPSPRSMVAENDLAVGRLVEAISNSRYWNDSAIFILEDDSQNGPDHVDSHRSPAFVVSPFTRRGAVDSTLYTTSAMLRTIELILGLPPMSQYDAAATPMYEAFQPSPVMTPFKARQPRVPLDERNPSDAFGAARSAAMDFTVADRAPEYELNEIIWKSVRGAASSMPPPVRAGFVRAIEEMDDEKEPENEPSIWERLLALAAR
jgi:DNA-binding beta-propeller fold protein YncE